ncbi:MAG: hypothetical protein U0325_18990 [Polyangiales bacterium]
MSPRRPAPARSSTSLPSLATLLATAAVAEGCAPVECGAERIDELAAHGPRGAESLGRGNVAQGLREIAVAVGAVRHETHAPPIALGGAPPPVTQTPVPTPQIQPPGGIGAVAPTPVEDPSPPEGSVRAVRPTPPAHDHATRGERRRVTPTPRD